MQQDRLERFVLENREAFNMAAPAASVWTSVAQRLAPPDPLLHQDSLETFITNNRSAFDDQAPNTNLWTAIEQGLDEKQDALEQFISANRADFDHSNPPVSVWPAIDKALGHHPAKTITLVPLLRVLRVAASIVLLLSVGATAGIYFTKSQIKQETTVASLEEISPEYAEMVRYYNAQIQEKTTQLVHYGRSENVLADLKSVDKMMEELEKELAEAPKGAEEQIIANLIRSYQIKIEILEKVLDRIESKKSNSENSKIEDDEITI